MDVFLICMNLSLISNGSCGCHAGEPAWQGLGIIGLVVQS